MDSKNIPDLSEKRLYHKNTQRDNLDMTLLVYKHIINSVQMSKYFYFLKVNGKNHFYFDEEYVRFYSLAELQKLTRANFKLSCVYGDFNGNLFNEAESNRMISVWKKFLSMDGVGKSTVAKAVARRLGAKYVDALL